MLRRLLFMPMLICFSGTRSVSLSWATFSASWTGKRAITAHRYKTSTAGCVTPSRIDWGSSRGAALPTTPVLWSATPTSVVRCYTRQCCDLLHPPVLCSATSTSVVICYTRQCCDLLHPPVLCAATPTGVVRRYTHQCCALLHPPVLCAATPTSVVTGLDYNLGYHNALEGNFTVPTSVVLCSALLMYKLCWILPLVDNDLFIYIHINIYIYILPSVERFKGSVTFVFLCFIYFCKPSWIVAS